MTSLELPASRFRELPLSRLRAMSNRLFAVNAMVRELEGFEVSAPSWFTRKYRHPGMATALHARAIRNQRNGAES